MTTSYTFDRDTFSDLHKDAFGYRPSHSFFQWLNCASDDELQEEWDSLCRALERRNAEDAEMEKNAIAAFEATVTKTIANGAMDRQTAIRWLMDAEERINGDVGYFEYLNGLPYGYILGKKSF